MDTSTSSRPAGRPPTNHSLNPNMINHRGRLNPIRPMASPTLSNRRTSGDASAARNVLVAVFGMTGTGKTSLIKTLAGHAARRLKTGHGLESCTQDIETVETRINGYNVTLVDTPGFDDSMRSDTEILGLIANWLQSSYDEDTFLSGIIYLHRISDIRMSGSSIKNLRMFRKLCGTENMSKVTLVTTMWDKVTAEEGALREEQLEGPDGFWSSMVSNGSLIKRHDGSAPSAQALVLDMLDNDPMMIKLQEEIASGKALIDTDAGASINEEILRLQKQHGEELEAVKDEMALAMKQGNKALQAQLQAEHAMVVAQLEKRAAEQFKLQQMRVSKLENDLADASRAREKFEKTLRAQQAASSRQEESARRLESEVRAVSDDNKRLEMLVETQSATLLAREVEKRLSTSHLTAKQPISPPTITKQLSVSSIMVGITGSKTLICRVCKKEWRAYGPGDIDCPSCKEKYHSTEAHWNSLAWDSDHGSKRVICTRQYCQAEWIVYGPGDTVCPSCNEKYHNAEAHWNSPPWATSTRPKSVVCSNCTNAWKLYGPGACECLKCKKKFINTEAHWNSIEWD